MSSKTKTTATKEEARLALVPKLRFPEFRGAEGWKQTPLAHCLDYQQPTPYLVADTKYSPAFKTPVLTAGKTFILGYTDEQHGIFSEGLPVIIFDDFTTATQFVDFPFKAKSSAMKILQAKNNSDIKFMYETLQTLSYEIGAHERHWISNFAPMLVPVPKPAEQQKVAECLSSVDELIAAQARKLDALKTHKKGLMQQLFPREGETQPRLRFPEFQNAGEWEESPLSKFILSLDAGVSVNSGDSRPADKPEFGVLKTSAITKGQFDPEENKVVLAESELSRLREPVIGGTIIMCRKNTPALVGANAYVESTHENLFLPDLLWAAKPREGVSMRFLAFILGSDKGRAALSKLAKGSSASMSNITKPEVLAYSVMAPAASEQQRIADCLNSLDALIAAQTQTLEALKTHKQGLMQQLFPSPELVEA